MKTDTDLQGNSIVLQKEYQTKLLRDRRAINSNGIDRVPEENSITDFLHSKWNEIVHNELDEGYILNSHDGKRKSREKRWSPNSNFDLDPVNSFGQFSDNDLISSYQREKRLIEGKLDEAKENFSRCKKSTGNPSMCSELYDEVKILQAEIVEKFMKFSEIIEKIKVQRDKEIAEPKDEKLLGDNNERAGGKVVIKVFKKVVKFKDNNEEGDQVEEILPEEYEMVEDSSETNENVKTLQLIDPQDSERSADYFWGPKKIFKKIKNGINYFFKDNEGNEYEELENERAKTYIKVFKKVIKFKDNAEEVFPEEFLVVEDNIEGDNNAKIIQALHADSSENELLPRQSNEKIMKKVKNAGQLLFKDYEGNFYEQELEETETRDKKKVKDKNKSDESSEEASKEKDKKKNSKKSSVEFIEFTTTRRTGGSKKSTTFIDFDFEDDQNSTSQFETSTMKENPLDHDNFPNPINLKTCAVPTTSTSQSPTSTIPPKLGIMPPKISEDFEHFDSVKDHLREGSEGLRDDFVKKKFLRGGVKSEEHAKSSFVTDNLRSQEPANDGPFIQLCEQMLRQEKKKEQQNVVTPQQLPAQSQVQQQIQPVHVTDFQNLMPLTQITTFDQTPMHIPATGETMRATSKVVVGPG